MPTRAKKHRGPNGSAIDEAQLAAVTAVAGRDNHLALGDGLANGVFGVLGGDELDGVCLNICCGAADKTSFFVENSRYANLFVVGVWFLGQTAVG